MSRFEIPALDTDRLRLRAFAERDWEAYAAMCADEEVMRHVGTGHAITREAAWGQMAWFNGHWTLKGIGMWALARREDDAIVGRAGFLEPPGWPALEVGWLLAREHWGKGYAIEAVQAALRHRATHFAARRCISLIRPGNTRSVRLAERVGATLQGEHELFGGPALVYAHAAPAAPRRAAQPRSDGDRRPG